MHVLLAGILTFTWGASEMGFIAVLIEMRHGGCNCKTSECPLESSSNLTFPHNLCKVRTLTRCSRCPRFFVGIAGCSVWYVAPDVLGWGWGCGCLGCAFEMSLDATTGARTLTFFGGTDFAGHSELRSLSLHWLLYLLSLLLH